MQHLGITNNKSTRSTKSPTRPQTPTTALLIDNTIKMSWSASDMSTNRGVTSYLDTGTATALTTRANTASSTSSVSPVTEFLTNSTHFGDNSSHNVAISTDGIPEPNKERATVASACVQCRSKHLKCDGLTPCSRCSTNDFECVYVRSRRGFKGPRRNGIQGRPTPISAPSDGQTCNMITPSAASRTSSTSSVVASPPDNGALNLPRSLDQPLFDTNQDLVSLSTKPTYSNMSLAERCIEAYFYHFHPAHPMLVPREYFMQLRRERNLSHLEAAMQFAGSFFVPQASTITIGVDAERMLYQSDCPRDGFRVQAMIIMCVASDGDTKQDKALKILLDAQEQAIELGMNRRDFAILHADGYPVLAESFRRTWWELFIVDGMIAGVHQKSTFPMKDIPADVVLPCEEFEYISGVSFA